ncbi:hypothetical protein N7532_009265 [Penicillium argentinense]|uniref:Uncharacterized protein n=1 Tax=Penicillium argentinense TaxID=1131581 RepID=A0A9W9EZ60_9EURO|nr:uncharacterized protein N7532_009265 [Penicillium argentinense]KAJ5090581.1 hypothetical protein N7532_009265 [Penicillium argentinense]
MCHKQHPHSPSTNIINIVGAGTTFPRPGPHSPAVPSSKLTPSASTASTVILDPHSETPSSAASSIGSLFSTKRKRTGDSITDELPESVSKNFERLVNLLSHKSEYQPTAATLMSFPLPQIQHQGLRPEPRDGPSPIDEECEGDDTLSITRLDDLYHDRLAMREQLDWECRRIGLRLMRLRELGALKALIGAGSSDEEGNEKEAKEDLWSRGDDDLLVRIRRLELKATEEREGRDRDE